jgi:hypothetical protein
MNLKNRAVNAYISGNYDLEINLYDQIEAVAVEFATNMALGIIKKRHQKKESSIYKRV